MSISHASFYRQPVGGEALPTASPDSPFRAALLNRRPENCPPGICAAVVKLDPRHSPYPGVQKLSPQYSDGAAGGLFLANVDGVLPENCDHPADGMAIDAVGVALPILHRIRMQAGGEGVVSASGLEPRWRHPPDLVAEAIVSPQRPAVEPE